MNEGLGNIVSHILGILSGIIIGLIVGFYKYPHNNDINKEQSLDKKLLETNHPIKEEDEVKKPVKPVISINNIPHHIAVIMDGNRRYGKKVYGDVLKGHWVGGQTLVDFVMWCMEYDVKVLTVYAFSSENWNRDASEINALMTIFGKYAATLLKEAVSRNIRINILSTDLARLPLHLQKNVAELEHATRDCTGFILNVCLSYGGRSDITSACRQIASKVKEGTITPSDVNEEVFASHLSTGGLPDPDLLIRTSGETRLSNFLPWQLAYTELLFVNKLWPEITKEDLLSILHNYSRRSRRYGL